MTDYNYWGAPQWLYICYILWQILSLIISDPLTIGGRTYQWWYSLTVVLFGIAFQLTVLTWGGFF